MNSNPLLVIPRPKKVNKRILFQQNPVLTQAGRVIVRHHEQFLQLQNSRQFGQYNIDQENRALSFTQKAQDIKRKVRFQPLKLQRFKSKLKPNI